MSFKDIAIPLVMRGIPVIPILPNSKKAFLPDWPTLASKDPIQIVEWDQLYPDYNGAAVATGKSDGVWFFEIDDNKVYDRVLKETGKEFPITYRVRSRPGRGHFYFRNTPASIAMGNLAQAYVKEADWSARTENAYVVAAGSLHPHTHEPYIVLGNEEIAAAPDWFVQWCISQKVSPKASDATQEIKKDARGLVPHGSIHNWMLHEAGVLRAKGLSEEPIRIALRELVEKNCAPPINWDEVDAMARSICNFPEGKPTDLSLTQAVVLSQSGEEPPKFLTEKHPVFPSWVMQGTSIYEKFVKPICDQNSRIDYFMWIPAMAMLLNYIGPRIKLKGPFGSEVFHGSIYAVLIGQKGKSNKSSSVHDAMNYFNYCGCLAHASRDIKNAEGRTLVWTAGSPEGLGLDMQRTGCRNAILYYDELSQLVNKAGIDGSNLNSTLLLMYEAQKFSNSVKSTKEAYSIDPDTYCASLITCTTDKKFTELWSRLAGSDTGLDDRFFFVYQPPTLPAPRLKTYVNTVSGSIDTKRFIDKALAQTEYAIADPNDPKLQALVAIENRYADRAIRWAVGFAIDRGLEVIDEDCIERACALVQYERDVKKYVKCYESLTREGQIQQEIRRQLEMKEGRMERRELERVLHAERWGTSLWMQSYAGLVKYQIIREEGSGVKNDPVVAVVMRARDLMEE